MFVGKMKKEIKKALFELVQELIEGTTVSINPLNKEITIKFKKELS